MIWSIFILPAYGQSELRVQMKLGHDQIELFPDWSIGDSLEAIRVQAFKESWNRGYFQADLDSISTSNHSQIVYMRSGNPFFWDDPAVRFQSDSNIERCPIRPGTMFSAVLLDSCLEMVLQTFTQSGYLEAELRIDSLLIDTKNYSTQAVVTILSGEKATLDGMVFKGVNYTGSDWLERVTALESGTELHHQSLQNSVARLEKTDLFYEVSDPVILKTDTGWLAEYTLQERPLALFDLVLGYNPGAEGEAGIMGNGALKIRNAGRDGLGVSLNFNRMQPRTGYLDASVQQQYLSVGNLGAEAGFRLHQQDTLWQTRVFSFRVWYDLTPQLRVLTGISREVSNAGQTTNSDVRNQRGSHALFGLHFQTGDYGLSPMQGFRAFLDVETGLQRHVLQESTVRQGRQRVKISLHPYIKLGRRHSLAPSAHASVLISREKLRNDLWRLGGASSLRGYREEQFYSDRFIWSDLEYRYFVETSSYLFAFAAYGMVHQPRMADTSADILYLRSFGAGMAFRTNLGQLRFSYAKSPEDTFGNAKIHVGIVADF